MITYVCLNQQYTVLVVIFNVYQKYCSNKAIIVGLIYIIGGMDKDYGFGSELTIVESFNPVTKEWEVLAPMNTPRANASVATLNGYIYVMGGFNTRDGDLASVERFSPEEVRNQHSSFSVIYKLSISTNYILYVPRFFKFNQAYCS